MPEPTPPKVRGHKSAKRLILIGWIAAIVVGGLANTLAEHRMQERILERATNGMPATAEVVSVRTPWYDLLGRSTKVRAVGVHYDLDGVHYAAEILWFFHPGPDPKEGAVIEVRVDPAEPALIATTTGGGSDGWRIYTPRLLLGAWILLATSVAVALSLRLQRPDTETERL